MAVTQSGRRATSWSKTKITFSGSAASLARFPKVRRGHDPSVCLFRFSGIWTSSDAA